MLFCTIQGGFGVGIACNNCFLYDYVKLLVYADKPETLDALEENIRRFIADI